MGQENLPWDLVEGKKRADDPRFWPGGAQLSGETFEDALIVDVDITAAELMGATFRNCTLARLDLRDGFMSEAHFENCIFYKCDLRRADLTDATLINVTIDRSNLCSAKFTGVKTKSLRLMRSEVSPCDFRKSHLDGFFSYCDLSAVNFDQADIQNLELYRCNIKFSRVSAVKHECTTTGIEAAERAGDHLVPWFLTSSERLSELPDGDLEECFFFGRDLSDADFSGRSLKTVNFLRCNLTGANFDGATLDNVWMWDCEVDQLHANNAKIPRLSMSYVMGSVSMKDADFEVWNVYDSELEGSNFQGSSINVGTFSMSQFPNSDFSQMKAFVVEAFMTDFVGCKFDGTDLSTHAAERSYFDEGVGINSLPISQSPLRHVAEAGDINFFYLPTNAAETPSEVVEKPPFQAIDDGGFETSESKRPEPLGEAEGSSTSSALRISPADEEPEKISAASKPSRPEFNLEPSLAEESKPKLDLKPEPKAEPKLDLKPEPKVEAKPEPKLDLKPEPKVEAKPEPKLDLKPEPKAESKPEPKLDLKPEPKAESKPEPKLDLKPEPKADSKPEPKLDLKPEPAAKRTPKPSLSTSSSKRSGANAAATPKASLDSVRPTARTSVKKPTGPSPSPLSSTSSDEVKRASFGTGPSASLSGSSKISPLGSSSSPLSRSKPSVPGASSTSGATSSSSPKPIGTDAPVTFGASNSSKLKPLGGSSTHPPFGAGSAAGGAGLQSQTKGDEVESDEPTKPLIEAPSIDLNVGAGEETSPKASAPDISSMPSNLGAPAGPPSKRRVDSEAPHSSSTAPHTSAPQASAPAPQAQQEESTSTDLIHPEPELGFFARIIKWFKSLFS